MNFGELKTLTSTWLDDLNYGYFTQAHVARWLNNAQYECQKLLIQAGQNYYTKPIQTTLVINQNEYVLPQDFLVLHRLEVVVSGTGVNQSVKPLGGITLNQQDLVNTGKGSPAYYFIKRDRLVLYPIPDTPIPLNLYYSPVVAEMTNDTDIPNVPVQYHEYLAICATIDGLLRDTRTNAEMVQKKLMFETPLKEMAELRKADASRSIVITGEYLDAGDYMVF